MKDAPASSSSEGPDIAGDWKMKLLFVMDPLARLQIAGDTTFAIMLAAQARGHDIWFCEPRHLSLEHADAVARAWPVTVRRVVGDHYLLGPQSAVPLKSCDAVLMRKDPPFDLDYYFATLLLERARGTTLHHQRPARPARAEREAGGAGVPRPLPAHRRHARDDAAAVVPGRAGRRDRRQAAGRVGRLRRLPRPQGRPQHGRDPRAGDAARPPLDDGAEVPARGAQGRQAHPAVRRRVPVRGAARARARRRARQPARRRQADGDQAGRTRHRDRARARPAPARGAATSSSAWT